jgi:RluA family pseudouridine synthase
MNVMPSSLLENLSLLFPTAKRTTLRRMIQDARVRVNGDVVLRANTPIEKGAKVEVIDPTPEKLRPARAKKLPFPVVFEDADLLVINKPAGLLTSTVPREKRATALAIIREHFSEAVPRLQIGLIHRLDRDASGLLIFSKNHETYLSLKHQFLTHSAERIYHALVHGTPTPPEGTIDGRLYEHHDGTMISADEHGQGQRAVTHYKTVSKRDGRSLLRVQLETGKKHQIRAQLKQRGVPIINDPVYSDEKPDGRLMLAAVELCITHPRTDKRMVFTITPPKGLRA